VMVLGELGLSRLGDIPGLTTVGAAAILAEGRSGYSALIFTLFPLPLRRHK
jgi:hypothetical protein